MLLWLFFFFFKQKTAYEMRISDWSSDVCSSDLIAGALFRGEALDLEMLTRRAAVIHDQIDAMDALEGLRAAEVPMLLVHDEYGHFEGLVTPADLLSAIAGEFASVQDIGSEPFVTERDDGSLLIAWSMPPDPMADTPGLTHTEDTIYDTPP